MPKLTHLLKAWVMSKFGMANANERSGKPETTKQYEMSIQKNESTNKSREKYRSKGQNYEK